jgi:hypothetical protein
MAKGALVSTWGSPVRGREMKGLDVFGEALTYFDKLAKQGRIQGVRTYVANTGDMTVLAGMLIVEGELSELQAVQLEPEYQKITAKAENIVDHLTIHLMTGGSPDDIAEAIGSATETLGELGIT